jgi:Holliday junction resolvase-like predicted endonuclease
MVSKKQRSNIIKAANMYSLEHPTENLSIRFDIISILDTGLSVEAEHIEDAFYPTTNQIKNFSC